MYLLKAHGLLVRGTRWLGVPGFKAGRVIVVVLEITRYLVSAFKVRLCCWSCYLGHGCLLTFNGWGDYFLCFSGSRDRLRIGGGR